MRSGMGRYVAERAGRGNGSRNARLVPFWTQQIRRYVASPEEKEISTALHNMISTYQLAKLFQVRPSEVDLGDYTNWEMAVLELGAVFENGQRYWAEKRARQ